MSFNFDTPITEDTTLVPVFVVDTSDPAIKYCPKTTNLELSPEGTVKSFECSNGLTGYIKYTCNDNGEWIEENKCTENKVNTTNDSNNILNNMSNDEIVKYAAIGGGVVVGLLLLTLMI